jgi:hypothetical protein
MSHPGHYGAKQVGQTFPVSFHVLLRQLDADGENANGQDDSSELESNGIDNFFITVTPLSGIPYIGSIGSWKVR